MAQNSVLGELFKRRVPQIAGLYIAATWMMIEIGDWMTARFQLPASVTSYIFVGMVVFIPSVLFLAYQYGKPGQDPWKKSTFAFVPFNLAISIAATFYFVNPVVATETKSVVNEHGVEQQFEVPKKEYQKTVINYFWENESGDPALDWLGYGFAWLLHKDLDRSLFISSTTLFSESNMLKQIESAGFKNGVSVPSSLKNQLGRQRFIQYSLNGKFKKVGDEIQLSVGVVDLLSGTEIAQHSVQGKNYLALIDELNLAVKSSLNIPADLNEQALDLPVSEHVSKSIPAIKLLIESYQAREFENDYIKAKRLVEKAIELDFSFASAYGVLVRVEQMLGNSEAAAAAIENALKHEYKFTTEEKFLYKADSYGVKGNYQSQVKIYDMWIELYPDSIDAHRSRARILTVTGIDHDKAKESLQKLRLLNPLDDSVLRNLAQVQILTNELAEATESLEAFIQNNPDNTQAMIELADVHERNLKFELARKTLEKILLLDPKNIRAGLKIVRIDMKSNQFEQAESRLTQMLLNADGEPEKFEVLTGYLSYYALRGEMHNVIETNIEMEKNAGHLPPILKIFTVKFQRGIYLATIGKVEEGLLLLNELKQQVQAPLNGIIDVGILSVYISSGDMEKSEKVLARLSEYFTQYPNPIFQSAFDNIKGQIAEAKGEHEQAVELYTVALKATTGSIVNSTNEDTVLQLQVSLARALNNVGKSEEAKTRLVEVLKRYPSLALANFELAVVYRALGNEAGSNQHIAITQSVWANAHTDFIEYKRFLKFLKKTQSE